MSEPENADEQIRLAEDGRLRALAELDNARKRLEREHLSQVRYANESLLLHLMPIVDNLEACVSGSRNTIDASALLEGVELTLAQFKETLASVGVVPIVAEVGAPFDPALHQAVVRTDHTDLPPDTITEVLRTGFRYHDRVLRPSQVAVAAASA